MSVFRDSGYIPVPQNYTDWWKKDPYLPVLDRQLLAYAWIVTPNQAASNLSGITPEEVAAVTPDSAFMSVTDVEAA